MNGIALFTWRLHGIAAMEIRERASNNIDKSSGRGPAMALHDYLRDEILEEAELGYISVHERNCMLAAFDAVESVRDSNVNKASATGAQNTAGESQNPISDAYPDLITARVKAKGNQSEVSAYMAKPRKGSGHAAVIVVHENKGLTPHIEDVTRRLAREGFVAIAPDLLSRRGGTSQFSNPVDATAALKGIRGQELVDDLMTVVSMLASDASVQPQRIGVVGFCFGGGMAWRLITQDSRIKAAVPYYGVNPNLKYVPAIQASVLAIYGELDERVNAGIAEITEAMEQNHKTFEKVIYPGAQHAFHNDTNPGRYHPEAARLAWQRTLEWLKLWLE